MISIFIVRRNVYEKEYSIESILFVLFAARNNKVTNIFQLSAFQTLCSLTLSIKYRFVEYGLLFETPYFKI